MPDNTVPGDPRYAGRVRPGADFPLPESSLVATFGGDIGLAAEAVVLRGYAGKTTNVDRAIEFMKIAERNGHDVPENDERAVENLRTLEEESLARLYLTPRLDRYVDFHRSCVLAWRHEANSTRQDMFTVWLRRYDKKNNVVITYRAIEEAVIGAAPAAYLGGELLDDALSQPSSQSSAWGSGAGATVGNRYWTAPACGG